jgi:hypothetical protein
MPHEVPVGLRHYAKENRRSKKSLSNWEQRHNERRSTQISLLRQTARYKMHCIITLPLSIKITNKVRYSASVITGLNSPIHRNDTQFLSWSYFLLKPLQWPENPNYFL